MKRSIRSWINTTQLFSPTRFISLPHGFHSCFHIAYHVYFLMCEWMTTSTPFQPHWSCFLCGERASLGKALTVPALGVQLIDSVWLEMVSWLITSVLHLSITQWVSPGSVKSSCVCVLKRQLKNEWFTGEDRLNWTGPAHTQIEQTLTSLLAEFSTRFSPGSVLLPQIQLSHISSTSLAN